MKHLLSGVALGAVLAFTGSAWAQNGAPMAKGHHAVHHHVLHGTANYVHHVVLHPRHRGMRGNDLANELNRQELSRIGR